MSSTPWRRGNVKLEVEASVEHVESASVPGGVPSAGNGKFWVRSDTPNVPMFTDDDGDDWVLNAASGGSAWASATAQTTGASSTNTIATPVSALPDGEQTSVEVQIFGVDTSDATNTYYRRQLVTYYRDGGGATEWTVVDSGRDERRGTFPSTLTAGLVTSGNDVIVNADTTGVTGTIDWTILYLTRDGIASGSPASTYQTTDGANVIGIEGAVTTMTGAETWFRLIDSGGSTTKPGALNNFFHYVAQYDGRVLRAALFTGNDPGSTTVRIYKDFEATASISATTATATSTAGGWLIEFEFASSALFSRGEVLIVSADTTNSPGDTTFNATLALTGLGNVFGDQNPWVTTVQTSSFTANSNTRYKYDASTFSGTISLPANPVNGDTVTLKNASANTSSVTLSGNGNNVEDPSTYVLAATVSLSGNGAAFTYSFDGTQWFLI